MDLRLHKKDNKIIVFGILSIFVVLAGVSGIIPEAAAVGPVDVGTAGNFGILGSTVTAAGGTTLDSKDLGVTTLSGPGTITVGGVTHTADAAYAQAGVDQNSAIGSANSQACTFNFAPGAIDLATDTIHGPIGIYTPGVYCVTGAMSIGAGGITLSGNGLYIFKSSGALTTVANSAVASNGADDCNVFWLPIDSATTLGANTIFRGTILDPAGITIGSTTTVNGRALAFGGTVTVTQDTINVPICTQIPPPHPGSAVGGVIIPVDMTSLFVAGAMTNAVWMIPTLGGIAGATLALFKIKRKHN